MPFVFDDEKKQGSSGGFVFDDEAAPPKSAKSSGGTVGDWANMADSAFASGVADIGAGVGTFVQDPGAAVVSGAYGARALADRGITWLLNKAAPESGAVPHTETQQSAQQASQFAMDRRAEGLERGDISSRVGKYMEDDSRRVSSELAQRDKDTNPELVRQRQNISEAEGFTGKLGAIAENPMGFSYDLIKSGPAMALGMGAGATLARAGAGGGALSATGIASEAATSAMQGREGVYQQVIGMPVENLAKGSERFQQILAQVQDPIKAREVLANELADQAPMLSGLATAAGSAVTNRLFGGDATAKSIASLAGKDAERITGKEFLRRSAQDTVEEGFQGVPEDAVQHGATVQADPNQKYDPMGSLAQNLAAGGAMGTGGHGFAYGRQAYSDWRNGKGPEEPKPAVQPAADGGQAVSASEILGRVEPPEAATHTNIAHAATNSVASGSTEEAEKALRAPVQLTSLDRVSEIDAAIKDMPADDAQLPALQAERAALTKDWPQVVPGHAAQFSTESGVRLEGQYALMDVADLVTSHDENLRSNEAYPQELQPRDRTRAASEMQVSGIVQRLDPHRLGVSADAATGAPIVGADGLVESGNARSIALKRVYQANWQKAEDYRQFLRDNAAQFGITPESVDSMQKPVLVRVRSTPVNRAEFARQANAATIAQMSPSEQAKSDAARIDSLEDLAPDDNGDFSGPASRQFVRRFMSKLPATEQASMIDSTGGLSTTGYTRVRNAVLAAAYGDSPVLPRLVESLDDNQRNLSKALMIAAPKVAQMRKAVAEGVRFDADITPDLLAAVEELARLKDQGVSVQDALAQTGMFGDKYSAETRAIMEFLAENARRPRRIADFIGAYMEALDVAGDPNQGLLLGDVQAPAKSELLTAAQRSVDDGNNAQNTQRGNTGEGAQAGRQAGGEPQDAQGSGRSNQGDGTAGSSAGEQETRLSRTQPKETSEWVDFPQDTGTIGIPRADMPQIKGEHRGALLQFLQARGIGNDKQSIQASQLKPTQAEFSTKKAAKWAEVRDGVDRSVLTSSDGHILDGHHQWVAALAANEPVQAIVLDAPIRELLTQVFQFPSVKQSDGATSPEAQASAQARQDFKNAMAELADYLADKMGARVMMVPNDAQVHKILVKLFVAAVDVVGTNMVQAKKWVKEQLKAGADTKKWWNKITDAAYDRAALEAVEQGAKQHVDDLFSAAEKRQASLFDDEPAAPKVATINGKPYDMKRDNFQPPATTSFIPADVIARAKDQIERPHKDAEPVQISKDDRARAEKLLTPLIDSASAVKVEYDQKIIDIAKRAGALGQMLASVKSMDSAVRKLVIDNEFDVGQMYDMLRSTVVVSKYSDAQAVLNAIRAEFEVMPGRIKNQTDTDLKAPSDLLQPKTGFLSSGYGQILVNVKLPGGVVAEIQINVPEMLAVKLAEGHALYEIERAEKEGSQARADAVALQAEIYPLAAAAARERAQAATEHKDSSVERLDPADTGKSVALVKYNSPVSSLSPKTRPSGNLTNSVASPLVPNAQPSGNFSGTFIKTSKASILPEADALANDPVERGHAVLAGNSALWNAIHDGKAAIEEFKAGFEQWVSEREAIEAALMKLKKDELLDRAGASLASRFKSESKAEIVKALWRHEASEFVLGRAFQYGMGKDSYINSIRAMVDATDAGQLEQYQKGIKEAQEASLARRAARDAGMQDPKTLEDYLALMTVKVREQGMTFRDARLSLPSEQRAQFDVLTGEKSRAERKTTDDKEKSTVRLAGQTVDATIVGTKHTQKGHDLYVVQMAERVSREDYDSLNRSAKRMGGYYSSFRGRGAVPGFQFTDRPTAEAFVKLANGDASDASKVAKENLDAFADDRSQTAVERLNEMADRLDARADASLGQERKANTERRARFAASAEAKANAEKAMAKTMRNIAGAIESGEAKFLDRVRQKAQVELLQGFVHSGQYDQLRAKYPNYADFEKHQSQAPTVEAADYAEFPMFTAYRSDLASLGRQLVDKDGTKAIGQRLMKVADDISDAFNKFAKDNVGKLMIYRAKDGGLAAFGSKGDAERAIAVSGFRGKAVPFMVKRGEYAIIASPSEAIERGLWKGDGDKRITLNFDFGEELVEKIGKAMRRGSPVSVPWQFESVYDKRKSLARLGLETPAEFRAALREFINLREQAAAPDKVKEMERSMIGRKNDGFDFFPTPAGTAEEMVSAAGIEPGMSVLEPSAGMGHIAEAIRGAGVNPDVGEIAEDRRNLLEAKGFNLVGRDFMDMKDAGYDRIIMNPPFSDARDIAHVKHAYDLLNPGGRLVAIMGESTFTNQNKKASEFRDWLERVGGTEEKLPEGTFLDPSLPVNTGANARMVVIEKPGKPLGATGSRLSRGSGGGMDFGALKALEQRIKANMPNMPRVEVLSDPSGAPEALQDYILAQGAWGDVEGAMHNGKLYLFASGLSDELRAEHVLAEHEAAHYGLRAILGKSLPKVMQAVFNNNAAIRKAAKQLQGRGKLSDIEAAEEVIVDIPSADLVQLKGWRAVTLAARDWFASRGYTGVAGKLSQWLAGSLTEQQRADLFVANLVREARAYVAGKASGSVVDADGVTRLSTATLASDIERQEKWLQAEARARGYKDIEDLLEKNYPLFEKLAELWRKKNPAESLLSRSYMSLVHGQSELDKAIKAAGTQLQSAMDAKRASGTVVLGRSPHVLSMALGASLESPRPMVVEPWFLNKTVAEPGTAKTKDSGKHFGDLEGVSGEDLARAMYRPAAVVEDKAEAGNFTLVTNILTPNGALVVNVTTKGSASIDGKTVPAVEVKSIYARTYKDASGKRVYSVADWINGNDPQRVVHYIDQTQIGEAVTGRLNPENKNPAFKGRDLSGALGAVNVSQASPQTTLSPISPNTSNVAVFGSPVNGNYRGLATVQAGLNRLLTGKGLPPGLKPVKTYGHLVNWIGKHYKGDPADKPMFSRAPATKTAEERADDIINNNAATAAPIDKLAHVITRYSGIEKVTKSIYNGDAVRLIDSLLPQKLKVMPKVEAIGRMKFAEKVKAGLVSDYGVPEAVIDRRTEMQGNQRTLLMKAGHLLEKISMMTRAESRAIYTFMNTGPESQEYADMEASLPADAAQVVREIRKMIDDLSQEAVRVGQLSPEAYKAHKGAYLRRSYQKYVAELSDGEAGARTKAISILGDQYKGRGMVDAVGMAAIKATDWWKRKLVAGKADTSLKGEKFIRLERRAPSGDGTDPLHGMTSKPMGKLLELVYWPAGEPMPAKYKDWTSSGTWEVRDTKGGNAIMWRDFTPEERQRMGEIDEARFAIAKTLHNMIHDVEVGKYLEWLGQTQAKKDGEAIPGVVVTAADKWNSTFARNEWVKVPSTEIEGTDGVKKYGKLAGQYIPGPVWNDLRQTVSGNFQPLGKTYANLLSAWKTSKTALSPAVHMNNIMSNFVMADWHDVSAGHVKKAMSLILAASRNSKREGVGGKMLRAAGKLGVDDADAAMEVLERYKASGGDIGSWVNSEIKQEQMKPILDVLEKEFAVSNGHSVDAQIGIYTALQHLREARFTQASAALNQSTAVKLVKGGANNLIDMYQHEDDVFRLAAWLKAKEEGKTDLEAGKEARKAFLDYNINAPWIAAMRNTGLTPFIAFTYRAIPMFLDTAANKPHKVMKLMLLAGALNYLGVMIGGGGDDKERKLLPEEKAGKIWGMVPKLIRMPWNAGHDSPVYLDIRRFIPVGDMLDVGQGHSAIPLVPWLMPGGILNLGAELVANKSQFTGKPIVLETDTAAQQTGKVLDYLTKSFLPNIALPNPVGYATEAATGVRNAGQTYAWTSISDAAKGKTDAFGREQSVAQAMASSFGVKLGAYPRDVLRRNLIAKSDAQIMEIDRNISALGRSLDTKAITREEYNKAVKVEDDKQRAIDKELTEKLR